MRIVRLWRYPRTRPRRLGARLRRSPLPRASRRVVLACCALLAAVTGVVQLAGQAQAVPSRWSVAATPNRGTGTDQLYGVSCRGPKFCMAVGTYGGDDWTLATAWNGHTWSIIPSPSPGGTAHSRLDVLNAVSCTSSSFCAAVGRYSPRKSFNDEPLAEIWNGKAWSFTPTRKFSLEGDLYGVSCLSATRCVAVGSRGTVTLVESWNGKTWSVVPSPSLTTNSVLEGVTCRGAASCVAAGSHDGAFGSDTLVESWNGRRWDVMASPNPAAQGSNWFTGVSCPTATSCEAVGGYGTGFVAHNLAESWDGKRWSVTTIPNRGALSNILGGVSCTSASNCVAAGFSTYGPASGPGNGKSLIESWDGSRWAITPSPSPRLDNELQAVTCTSVTECEAVGYDGKGSLLSDKTFVETGS
jgi:hypothetical protein